MSVIDNAIYRDGKRLIEPTSLDETFELCQRESGFAWIGLADPTDTELDEVAAEFGLHPLAVEDARIGHQRPKLDRYGDQLFLVLRPAFYIDATEKVEFGELHFFVGTMFAVSIRRGYTADPLAVRHRLEADATLLSRGAAAIVYGALDVVVDGYEPVIAGLENDIDEIEDQLFSGDPAVTKRIYDLAVEVMGFQRATKPLLAVFDGLTKLADEFDVDLELRRSFRDVKDHILHVVEKADGFRELLGNALDVHGTLVAQRQNDVALAQTEQTKKISGWAAVFFAPSLVGTIYGMNFRYMPELDWHLGYPGALVAMFLSGLVLYLIFKRKKWI
ncbi:CorA family divalent cation transporter [Agromyces seonyuensis]|uniref:Transporter n=1 Tax=Agromyces seonyuensis TaxID=2662446 RepID=A0A6I4P858_9MICO|nr:transporter [Agromyces seonyuensis]